MNHGTSNLRRRRARLSAARAGLPWVLGVLLLLHSPNLPALFGSAETLSARDAVMIITRVRLEEPAARDALQNFVFGGPYGGLRVPRGIEPEFVGRFLSEAIGAETDSGDLTKALAVLRFYERPEVLRAVRPMLLDRPSDYKAARLQLIACQVLGDLGGDEDRTLAANRVGAVLARHPAAINLAGTVLETFLVLAPAGDLAVFDGHVAAELAVLTRDQGRSEAAMTAYDKVAAIHRNDLPRARARIEYKLKVLAMEPSARRKELVRLYLGRAPMSDAFFQVWSGRLLRREAAESAGENIVAEFRSHLGEADAQKVGLDRATDVLVHRATRAIVYLGGTLTPAEQALVGRAGTGTMDFLWDE